MNKEDRIEIEQLKHNQGKVLEMLEMIVSDKYDPKNGWKTERRVFEQKTIDKLEIISDSMKELKDCVGPMTEDVKMLKRRWKVVFWVLSSLFLPVLIFLINNYLANRIKFFGP